MPWRCATVSLAVPMSMPRYSCMESALMISPPSSRASRSARSDLPAAVGPSTAITGSAMPPVCHRRAGRELRPACPPACPPAPGSPGPDGSGLRGGRGPAGSAGPACRSCPGGSRPGSAAGHNLAFTRLGRMTRRPRASAGRHSRRGMNAGVGDPQHRVPGPATPQDHHPQRRPRDPGRRAAQLPLAPVHRRDAREPEQVAGAARGVGEPQQVGEGARGAAALAHVNFRLARTQAG